MKLFFPVTINFLKASSWHDLPVDQEPVQESLGPEEGLSLRTGVFPWPRPRLRTKVGAGISLGTPPEITLTCSLFSSISNKHRSTPKTPVSGLVLPDTAVTKLRPALTSTPGHSERGYQVTPSPGPLAQHYNFVLFPFVLSSGFPGVSEGKASACNVGDSCSIPGSGRSLGEGNGKPLQYSCLENSMDRGAW